KAQPTNGPNRRIGMRSARARTSRRSDLKSDTMPAPPSRAIGRRPSQRSRSVGRRRLTTSHGRRTTSRRAESDAFVANYVGRGRRRGLRAAQMLEDPDRGFLDEVENVLEAVAATVVRIRHIVAAGLGGELEQ